MFGLSRRASSYSRKLRSLRERRRARLRLEEMESRTVPSVFTPAQIRHAYGFDQINFTANGKTAPGDGSGQTIAIVDAFDAPTIQSDLNTFDKQFNIPNVTVMKGNPSGVLPGADAGWAQETSLDVEWAHAIAPKANILLVEATSDSLGDLLTAVSYAANQTGVSAVSMSWGGGEFSTQTLYDSVFTTPAGHGGVTFVASSGDNGAWYGVEWPASSPNVLSVGGTSLRIKDSKGTYSSETGWSGSGGGYSNVESEPSYQYVAQNSGARTTPDLAYVANPNTGVYVYDSYPASQAGWYQFGGTSVGAPQISAMIAIANQGRALAGKGALDGPSQTLPYIYSLASRAYSTYFHDITSGFNGYAAGRGYDLVTGLGSPKANALVSGLVISGAASASSAVRTTSNPAPVTSPAGKHDTPTSPAPGQGSTPTGASGQQTPLLILFTVNPPFASAAGFAAAQNAAVAVTPKIAVADPRAVPLAVPAPRVAETRVESGGGNNPLNADDRDMDTQPDMDMAPVDVSANAPRMAPARLPAAARQETATAWRQARDLCFANDQWSSPVSQTETTATLGEEPATDSMAAQLGLGVVLGSYWGVPTREEEQRKKDAANFNNQES